MEVGERRKGGDEIKIKAFYVVVSTKHAHTHTRARLDEWFVAIVHRGAKHKDRKNVSVVGSA